VPLIAEYDAIRFIFDYYKFKYHRSERDNPDIDLFNKVRLHYEEVSRNLGYEEKPGANLVTSFGYYYLSKKQFEKAEKFFRLNVANYPQNFRVYDAYGDYFKAVGDSHKAMANYMKSISLNEDSHSKAKLEKLQHEINKDDQQ
jgi:tetratricopeptide (TPR) repeat protein